MCCPICKSDDVHLIGIKQDRITVNHKYQDFEIMKCYNTSCGTYFTNYSEAWNTHSVYDSNQYHVLRQDQTNHTHYEDRFDHDCSVARMRLERAFQYTRPGNKFLDIGCSNAALVYEASKSGLDAYGTDISSYIINNSKEHFIKLGLNPNVLETNNVDLVDLPWNEFDIVQLNDVVEHSVDATEMLIRINNCMKSKGILFIDTPDFDWVVENDTVLGSRHMKPIEHCFFATRSTLKLLVKNSNFELVDMYYPIPGKMVAVARKR